MDSKLKQESKFYGDFEDKLLHVIAKAHVINLSSSLSARLALINPENTR